MTLNIIFPVLNEHLRLWKGITGTIRYMEHYCEKYEEVYYVCTIVDNGSDDDTPEIAQKLMEEYPDKVRYIRIETRGVGIAFRTGVERNEYDIVGTMDIDLSTEIKNLGRTLQLFKKNPTLEYVNATRFAKGSETVGRKWYRKVTSAGLVTLLKLNFGMKASDAICGFTFMKKDVAKALTAECSDDPGWFYMIELLLRAERRGVHIYNMPVRFVEDYNTTVNVGKTVRNYMQQIHALKKQFAQEDREEKSLLEEQEILQREAEQEEAEKQEEQEQQEGQEQQGKLQQTSPVNEMEKQMPEDAGKDGLNQGKEQEKADVKEN